MEKMLLSVLKKLQKSLLLFRGGEVIGQLVGAVPRPQIETEIARRLRDQ